MLILYQVMVEQGVISSLPAAPDEVWNTGMEVIGDQETAMPGDSIPCCNTAGKIIASELGPAT